MGDTNSPTFAFDESVSADENIRLFLDHLATVDAAFAALLKSELDSLLDGFQRDKTRSRKAFAARVASLLDGVSTSGAPRAS